MKTIQSALNWVIGIAFMLAVLALFWGGFVLLTANGNTSALEKAKTILKNVIIGLFLIAASFMIVDFVFTSFGVTDGYKKTSNN